MAEALIGAAGISRCEGGSGKMLLRPCDCDIFAGDRIALTGTSGAGKSVLLRTLSLLDWPQTGSVAFRGRPVGAADVPDFRRQVAYVRQQSAFIPGSVADNLRLPFRFQANRGSAYDEEALLALLAPLGRGTAFLQQEAQTLSGGEAQLVALLRSLQLNPCVLLLDEPTAALDRAAAAQIEALLLRWYEDDPKRAWVWISHDPEQAARMGAKRWEMVSGCLNTAPLLEPDSLKPMAIEQATSREAVYG